MRATTRIFLAGILHNEMIGAVSVFWLMIVIADFFYDGGFAVIGPYLAEVWPTRLRSTGMGSAYGFGGIGKIIGPLGLAVIVGTSDVITPKATIDAIVPSFMYFTAWMALCGCAFLFFGFETVLQGWLIYRSGFLPRFLGVLSMVGGAGWLTFLWPPLGSSAFVFVALFAIVGVILTAGWLLVRGVDDVRWRQRATLAASSIWR